MIELLRDLMLHHEWGDAEFFRMWAFSGHVTDSELLKRTHHFVLAQTWFVTALRKEEINLEKLPEHLAEAPDFDELKLRAQKNHERAQQFLESVWEEDLNKRVVLPWFPPPPCTPTIAEAVMQLVLHTHGHRAQNIARLNQRGVKTIALDFLIWKWNGTPRPSWV